MTGTRAMVCSDMLLTVHMGQIARASGTSEKGIAPEYKRIVSLLVRSAHEARSTAERHGGLPVHVIPLEVM